MPPLVPASTKCDAARAQALCPTHRVTIVGVGSVDQHVSRLQQPTQLFHRLFCGLSGGEDGPDHPRRWQAVPRAPRATERARHLPGPTPPPGRGTVADHHAMASRQEPSSHVGSHPAQSDETSFHVLPPLHPLWQDTFPLGALRNSPGMARGPVTQPRDGASRLFVLRTSRHRHTGPTRASPGDRQERSSASSPSTANRSSPRSLPTGRCPCSWAYRASSSLSR